MTISTKIGFFLTMLITMIVVGIISLMKKLGFYRNVFQKYPRSAAFVSNEFKHF